MRKILFAALAAMVMFASCDKDNNDGLVNEGQKAVLNITLENPPLKATGTAPATDNTVTNFTAFIIDDAGYVKWETFVTGSGLSSYTVTTKATKIYVVANAGNQTGKYATETTLLDAIEDLGEMYTARWATGSASINWGSGTTATVPVTMQFIAARITVKVDNRMENYDGTTTGTVIINSIAVLNARGQSKLFGASGASLVPATYGPDTKFLMGFANPTSPYDLASYPSTDFTVDAVNLMNNYTFVDQATTTDFYYYVYETGEIASGNPATIVTLVGSDVNGEPAYWPVHLSQSEDWKTGSMTDGIIRGNSYNITITLTGDATSGNGGGTTDPFEPVVSATLNATLSITDWNPVDLEKEF